MDKYKKEVGEDLLDLLLKNKLLEYGATFTGKMVREALSIEIPPYSNKETFAELALYELSAIDYVRKHLLANGKYIKGESGDYRILIPSENKRQCESYISSANKKLGRSLMLSRNTPKDDLESHEVASINSKTVRAIMAKDSLINN